ncbi:MAG: hypothetical protein ABW116_14040 [Candidatus Sedimenticola sp. 20ELBAFRAG]
MDKLKKIREQVENMLSQLEEGVELTVIPPVELSDEEWQKVRQQYGDELCDRLMDSQEMLRSFIDHGSQDTLH